MKLKRAIVLIMLLRFFTGCSDYFMICSLHPFYLEKNVVLVSEAENTWIARTLHARPASEDNEDFNVWNKADTASEWNIERFISRSTVKTGQGKDSTVCTPMNYYTVRLVTTLPDTVQYEFRMVLFRVKGDLYADFMPAGHTGLSASRFATESYLKVHTLARVYLRDSGMDISWLGAENMKEMIEKKRVRVSYKWIPGAKRLLLTGSSEQLTGMIERYADESRFIDWENQPAMLKLNLTHPEL